MEASYSCGIGLASNLAATTSTGWTDGLRIHCASVRFLPRRCFCVHMWKWRATVGSDILFHQFKNPANINNSSVFCIFAFREYPRIPPLSHARKGIPFSLFAKPEVLNPPHQNAVGMAGNGGSWSSHRFWGIPSLAIIHKLSLRERNAWIPFARAYPKPDSKPPRKWHPLANMRFRPGIPLAEMGQGSSDRWDHRMVRPMLC